MKLFIFKSNFCEEIKYQLYCVNVYVDLKLYSSDYILYSYLIIKFVFLVIMRKLKLALNMTVLLKIFKKIRLYFEHIHSNKSDCVS